MTFDAITSLLIKIIDVMVVWLLLYYILTVCQEFFGNFY